MHPPNALNGLGVKCKERGYCDANKKLSIIYKCVDTW